jgi:DNA topoisomerase-1
VRLRRSDPAGQGIRRRRAGRGFRYLTEQGAPLVDEDVLARIAALAIPPAWTEVWICPAGNGHIQAMGTDVAGRRQYLYHEAWRAQRDRAKFDRALELAAALPAARRHVSRVLAAEPAPSRERALAAAFRILDAASLRIGSEQYAAENGSHGLATLLCSHVTVDGDGIRLEFPAKSGQAWESTLEDHDLAVALGALLRRRSGRLLAWRDGAGWHPLSPGEINDYIRERTRGEFTAKDFRTLHGTIVAAQSLRRSGARRSPSARSRAIAEAMREAGAELGNTPAVARGSYVDPRVIDRYLAGEVIAATGAPEAALLALLS